MPTSSRPPHTLPRSHSLSLTLGLGLGLGLGLSSLVACAGDPSPTGSTTTAGPAATPVAGPTEDVGSRSLEPGQQKRKPKNNNLAPTSTGIPTGGQVPTAVVLVDGKAVIMSEGRHATLRMDPDQTWWTGKDLALNYHDGLRLFSVGDVSWWQPGAMPASAAKLGDILAASGQVGSWVEVETLKSGRKRVWVNVGGKRTRLGMFKTDPVASIYLLSPAAAHRGKTSLALTKATGFVYSDAGAPQNTLPTGATAVPHKAPDAGTQAQWTGDLSRLRGGASTITWATLLDLNGDGSEEGFACVKGGKDDQDCYAVEPADAGPHYHGVSSMRFSGGAEATAPLAFTLNGGTYIMHATGSGETARLWIARYDGGDYIVEGVR